MKAVIEMTQVVYADILFIINTYVTYALLRATALFCRAPVSRLRTVLVSLLGGAFSFIVLFDCVPNYAIAVSRLVFAAALVFASYFPAPKRKMLRLFFGFFLVNFVFAGVMFALWFFFAPRSMLFFAGIVYFDIDAATLIIYTAACYGIVSLANSLLKMKAPSNSIYELEIGCFGKSFSCRALLDTGNSLFEPFSSFPVIVCEKSVFENDLEIGEEKLRLVPCSSVRGESVLKAFRPDYIHIKGLGGETQTNSVYVALTDEKIKNSQFGALLHPQLLTDINEKGGKISCSQI